MMIICVKTWLFKLTKLNQVINKYTVVLNPVTYLVLVLLTFKKILKKYPVAKK